MGYIVEQTGFFQLFSAYLLTSLLLVILELPDHNPYVNKLNLKSLTYLIGCFWFVFGFMRIRLHRNTAKNYELLLLAVFILSELINMILTHRRTKESKKRE